MDWIKQVQKIDGWRISINKNDCKMEITYQDRYRNTENHESSQRSKKLWFLEFSLLSEFL